MIFVTVGQEKKSEQEINRKDVVEKDTSGQEKTDRNQKQSFSILYLSFNLIQRK